MLTHWRYACVCWAYSLPQDVECEIDISAMEVSGMTVRLLFEQERDHSNCAINFSIDRDRDSMPIGAERGIGCSSIFNAWRH